MPASLRPLTTGQLLDRTFHTYRQNFTLFVGISAVPYTCVLIMQLATLVFTTRPGTHPGLTMILVGTGIAILFVVASIVATAVSTAATTFAVSDINLETGTSISACFGRVKGKVGRVIYASIEYGLRVGLGFILLIVPGVYWAGKYGLAVPAVVLEDIKGKQACGRSSELTKDAVGRIVVIYFLTYILTVAFAVGAGAALGAIAPSLTKAAGTITATAFQYIISAIVRTLVFPVMSIALTLAYYDQRVRKEAFDIENLMSLLDTPAEASAAKTAEASI